MERRKLQATGGASLTLTLPKAWVSSSGLQSKDQVLIIPDGKALIIKPLSAQLSENKIDINVDGLTEARLVRELVSAYISGADKITFRSKKISPAQRQIIQKALQLLFGFEILEETSKKIYIKNIFDDAKLSVPESTQKIFLITRTMFEDSLKAVTTGDKNLALAIEQRDLEVNKLLCVVRRRYYSLIKGKTDGSVAELGYYVDVAIQLERIADHAVLIAKVTADSAALPSLYDNFGAIEAKVVGLFDDVERVVNSLDKNLAHEILDQDEAIRRLISGSKRAKKSSERLLIENSLDRLRGYIMNIAELTIDYSFTRP
jgi:phosphate uptake regulator